MIFSTSKLLFKLNPEIDPNLILNNQYQKRHAVPNSADELHGKIKNIIENNNKDSNEVINKHEEVSEEIIKMREEHKKELLIHGEILPENHFASKFLSKIVEKLNPPKNTKFVLLDSESSLAYYHTEAKMIVISRGVLRFIAEKIKNPSEDHIAGILSHEIAHAYSGKEFKHKPWENPGEYFMETHDHAEELQADREGIINASFSGYNPLALKEFFREKGLTKGRFDPAHPENIDRIRKLEKYEGDDEQALPNCSKKYLLMPKEIVEWAKAPSDVYAETEKLLSYSHEEIKQALEKTNSVGEFLRILDFYKQTKVLASAKTFLNSNITEEMFINKTISDALSQLLRNPEWKETDQQVDWQLNLRTNTPYRKLKEMDSAIISDLIDGKEYIASRNEHIPQHAQSIKYEENEDDKLNIQQTINTAKKAKIPKKAAEFLSLIEESYHTKNIHPLIMKTIFSKYDIHLWQKFSNKTNEKSKKAGIRSLEFNIDGYFDFDKEEEKNIFSQEVKLNLLLNRVKNIKIEQEHVTLFTKLLITELGLEYQIADYISKLLLVNFDEGSDAWDNYLQTLEKEKLLPLIKSLQKIIIPINHFSPIRSMHSAYQSFEKYNHTINNEDDNKYIKKTIKEILKHTINELVSRGVGKMVEEDNLINGYIPEVFSYYLKKEGIKCSDIQLSYEEWQEISKLNSMFKQPFSVLAIKFFLKNNGDLMKLHPILQKVIIEMKEFPVACIHEFTVKDIFKLMKYNPWDNQKIQIIFKNLLCGTESSIEGIDNTQLESFLVSYYFFIKNNPINDKSDYFLPSLFSLSNKILDLRFKNSKENIDVVLIKMIEDGFICDSIYKISSIAKLNTYKLNNLLQVFEKSKNQVSEKIIEYVIFLIECPENIREKIAKEYDNFLISSTFINYLIEHYNNFDERASKIIKCFPKASPIRDHYLVTLWEQIENNASKIEKIHYLNKYLSFVSQYNEKHSPSFNFNEFANKVTSFRDFKYIFDDACKKDRYKDLTEKIEKKYGKSYKNMSQEEQKNVRINEFIEKYMKNIYPYTGGSEELIAKQFPNLLLRRHNFLLLSQQYTEGHKLNRLKENDCFQYGSPLQRFIAFSLSQTEEKIFSFELLEDKINGLCSFTSQPSIVRDIYIEKFFRDELEKKINGKEKIRIGKLLLPLFTEKSDLKTPFAIEVLDALINETPDVLKDYKKGLSLIKYYLPQASYTRNHYLDKLEIHAHLKPDNLMEIYELRLTEEGKIKNNKEENSPKAFIYSRLGEIERIEKGKTLLWLLGIALEKPKSIIKIEDDYNGHLNNLPKFFAKLTPPEQKIIIERLCTGAEGILDIEAVSKEKISEAINQRNGVLNSIISDIFKEETKETKLFKKIFKNLLSKAETAKGTQLLSNIISEFLKCKIEGNELTPPKVVRIMLEGCGIIGKKVAQGLAGLPLIKNDYPEYAESLKETQGSTSNIVPKRALLTYAKAEGLLDGNKGIKIISFDKLLKAASNKQACLLTVEITDKKYGLPLGIHKVVGKFKRPSAQKVQNIKQDLELARSILSDVSEETKNNVPEGFIDGIEYALLKELNFKNEFDFSKKLKHDLESSTLKMHNKMTTSDIFYVGEDLVLETLAEGISFRDFLDDTKSKKELKKAETKKIAKDVFTAAIAELVIYGNVHTDLHPENFFVDTNNKKITLIDKGMHENLDTNQRNNVAILLSSLTIGNEQGVRKSLHELGWNTGKFRFEFKNFKFMDNVNEMLAVSRHSKVDPFVMSIIYAISKLGEYADMMSKKDIVECLANIGQEKLRKTSIKDVRNKIKNKLSKYY